MNTTTKTLSALSALALMAGSAQAAIVELTSVDQLDMTNVVKAYDFTGTTSLGTHGATFDIAGQTFTRHRWNDAASNGGNGTAFDGMTLINVNKADNQGNNHPSITLGGDVTDRARLNELLSWWNIGQTPPMTISVALANGTYKVQYLVGTSGGGGGRDNKIFNTTDGANELLGAWQSTSNNYLITGDIVVTGGVLTLSVADGGVTGDSRPVVSGLIISQVPEPGSLALLGLGGLLIARRRRG